MPSLTCPHCNRRGRTGPAFAYTETSQGEPEILAGPQMPGSTKSLLLCRFCGGAFAKGPVGRAKQVSRDVWDSYHQHMKVRLSPGMKMLEAYGQEQQAQPPNRASSSTYQAAQSRKPASDFPQTQGSDSGFASQNATPKKIDTLSKSEKDALGGQLTTALDDVLDVAAARTGIYPEEWAPEAREFFIGFTRLMLGHAMLTHDEAVDCGATSESLPYLQLLFGLRPALESAGSAWKDSGGTSSGESPMRHLVELAGPLQLAIGDTIDDDDVFIRAQKRIYPDLESPE